MPTTRAPRRASHEETYAVPQPSSMASLPLSVAGKHAELGLGHAPYAPGRPRLSPVPLTGRDVVRRLLVPMLAVVKHVVGSVMRPNR